MLTAHVTTATKAPAVFLFVLLTLPFVASGQPPASEAQTDKGVLQAFAAEIRQLRIAIEETLSILPRMQLTITRFQMQQERVDRRTRASGVPVPTGSECGE